MLVNLSKDELNVILTHLEPYPDDSEEVSELSDKLNKILIACECTAQKKKVNLPEPGWED